MSAQRISGLEVAQTIREELVAEVARDASDTAVSPPERLLPDFDVARPIPAKQDMIASS